MQIDCEQCTVRGRGCGDCVVTVILGGPPIGIDLDEADRVALAVLADSGLVPPLRLLGSAGLDGPAPAPHDGDTDESPGERPRRRAGA
jgi:hypothetical protein